MRGLVLVIWSFVNVDALFCGNRGKLGSKTKLNGHQCVREDKKELLSYSRKIWSKMC